MKPGVIQGVFPAGLAHLRARQGAPVQAKPNGAAVQLPQTAAQFHGAGQPLEPQVRQRMESFFGTSFADVRIHVGPQASTIGAVAFTQGSNIHFAPGQYNPNSPQGQRILGHELAHVVQQRAGRVRNPFGSGTAIVQDAILEAEAARMAQRAAQAPAAQPKMPAALQRNAQVHVTAPVKTGDDTYRIAANRGGQQIGSVMVHARSRSAIEVTDLGVSADHRKQGLGNVLMKSALQTGLQLGKSNVVLSSQDNGSGHLTAWYKKMGFTPAGRDHRGLLRLEAPISRVMAGVAHE